MIFGVKVCGEFINFWIIIKRDRIVSAGASSSGRTRVFGTRCGGSNPPAPAIYVVIYREVYGGR